jgi:hypothetical protein
MPAIVLLGVHVLTPHGCILASLTRFTCMGVNDSVQEVGVVRRASCAPLCVGPQTYRLQRTRSLIDASGGCRSGGGGGGKRGQNDGI